MTVLEWIKNLMLGKFWGTVILKFEGGSIVHVRKEEGLKVEKGYVQTQGQEN